MIDTMSKQLQQVKEDLKESELSKSHLIKKL